MSPRQAAACCRPVDSCLDAEWFKALADPTRLLILGCLVKSGGACSVGEIAACCSVDLSVVSRHLRVLDRAGLLASQKQGRAVFYRVRYAEACQTLRALADAIEQCCPAEGRGGKASGGKCCPPR